MRVVIPLLLACGLGLAGCDRAKEGEPQEQASLPAPKISRELAGTPAKATPFLGPDDAPASLANFRGKPLLVNLWATWCAPCLKEMPALDRLAAREAGRLQVIVVSQDIEGRKAVTPYFAKMQFKTLQPYLDKDNVLALAVGAEGLPVTLLYDSAGKEVWRVNGEANWDSPEIKALIDEAG